MAVLGGRGCRFGGGPKVKPTVGNYKSSGKYKLCISIKTVGHIATEGGKITPREKIVKSKMANVTRKR